MLIKLKRWQLRNSRNVAISPNSVASVTEEGHHPPACTIETHGGTKILVEGTFDEVTKKLEATAVKS